MELHTPITGEPDVMGFTDICAGPTLPRGNGCAARAVVLRVREHGYSPYVVHDRYSYSDGTCGYGNGDYCKDFHTAHRKWVERLQEAAKEHEGRLA